MKIKLLLVIAASIVSTLAVAAGLSAPETDGSIFTCGDPSLHLVRRDEDKNFGPNFYRWAGLITLTGTLVVEFDRPQMMPDDLAAHPSYEKDTDGYSFFVPDERSRQRLPRAIGNVFPAAVDSIDLDKRPRELLPQMIGPENTQIVLLGTTQRYEWPVEITIRSFATETACNHRSYFAEVESVRSPMPTLTAQANNSLIGC